MAGSRDFFLCGAGRRFSVIRVPRGSEIVTLDGRRTRAADSEGNRLSVQSGSLCLCFHAASDSLSVCRGRCRNRKWRPYWLTPGLSHREQLCDTWRTSCGPFSLLIMVVELNFSYYSTRMDWRLLYILLGLTCWSDRKWNNEVTAWKQFPHVWQMKRWTTGDDNHGLLGC